MTNFPQTWKKKWILIVILGIWYISVNMAIIFLSILFLERDSVTESVDSSEPSSSDSNASSVNQTRTLTSVLKRLSNILDRRSQVSVTWEQVA